MRLLPRLPLDNMNHMVLVPETLQIWVTVVVKVKVWVMLKRVATVELIITGDNFRINLWTLDCAIKVLPHHLITYTAASLGPPLPAAICTPRRNNNITGRMSAAWVRMAGIPLSRGIRRQSGKARENHANEITPYREQTQCYGVTTPSTARRALRNHSVGLASNLTGVLIYRRCRRRHQGGAPEVTTSWSRDIDGDTTAAASTMISPCLTGHPPQDPSSLSTTTPPQRKSLCLYYRPQTKFREGNVFTGVSLSTGVGVVWICPTWMQTFQAKRQTPPPARRQTPWIRSTGGRYASYWNASVFLKFIYT